jgi:hypothetical protein
MPISYQEPIQLSCPACGADVEAQIWLILDAQEEPAAVDALLAGELNLVVCPHCARRGPAGAPLLYHDAAARRVIFAAAPGAAEHEVRDQARELHALLVGSIPEEQRRPYLVDVDIAQDVDGIAHLVRRLRKRRPAEPTPPPAPATPSEPPALLVAVEALLAADSAEELDRILASQPILLDPATDTTLAQLIEVAVQQREPAVAESLRQARTLLRRMSATLEQPTPADAPTDREALIVALLATTTADELMAVVAAHPELLQIEADRLLAERVDLALDEGNERLAQALEDRREALLELRRMQATAEVNQTAQAAVAPTLDEAIEALLTAEGEAALVEVIDHYPLLLDPVAADALWQFAAEARASGDEELAVYAIECRELLRRVREGLG